MEENQAVIDKVSATLIKAGSSFSPDKIEAYRRTIREEHNEQAIWAMETILKNAEIAEQNQSPLCDDTGIPHIVLDVGPHRAVTGSLMESIEMGVRRGLELLPGRPMAVVGDEGQRLDQSKGMSDDPADLEAAPILIRRIKEDELRLHVLMFGGGPAIRGKTYRIFHKHSVQSVLDEIVLWAREGTSLLGCSPCTLAVGVGRSHYEATSMMLQSLVDGRYNIQSDMEREITNRVNELGTGPIGLGGKTTVLATFMKVGPQRASGVRIVCVRPCCCFEPRMASCCL